MVKEKIKKQNKRIRLVFWSTENKIITDVLIFRLGYQSIELSSIKSGNHTFVLNPINKQLDQVVVDGFNNKSKLNSIAGSVRKLSSYELNRFNEQSLVRPLSLVPGLTFEERAASSYRVSIRGSSLRSPFGVRNVKFIGMIFHLPIQEEILSLTC